MSHTLFCVLGRTSSGKSTIVKKVADELGMKVLKSYTTREMRPGETEESADHIFIKPEDVEKYRDDMVAYTERVGYCSFATKSQLMNADFYIINPVGLYELILKTKDMDINIVTIYVTLPKRYCFERAKERKDDMKKYEENYNAENLEFTQIEKDRNIIHYRILNTMSIDWACERMKSILEREAIRQRG